MQQNELLHSAPHDRSFFQQINFFIAIGVVVFGLWTGEFILALLGLGVGIMYWFTTPRQYHILMDRIVVEYGQPRIMAVPLEAVTDVQKVQVPLTSGIFIRRQNRQGIIIRPRDMDGFIEQLWDALERSGSPATQNRYAGESPEGGADGGPELRLYDGTADAPESDAPPGGDATADDGQPPAAGPTAGR